MIYVTMSAMLDVPPPEADHAVRPAAGDSRANALATLGFAVLSLGSTVVTAVAAVLCLIAAGRGPAAQRAWPETQPGTRP
jgi:hypothetical protein